MKKTNKEFQLPRDFGEKWVSALRSGEYKQGDGFLLNDDKYCCLGVACVIEQVEIGYCTGFPFEIISSSKYKLPLLLLETSKDYTSKTHVDDQPTFVTSVACLNDQGKTFEEIADWIEANVNFT